MLFAKSTVHCMPLAKHLHILLFDDLLYVRTLSFMHNVWATILMYIISLKICLFAYPLSILIVLDLSLIIFI